MGVLSRRIGDVMITLSPQERALMEARAVAAGEEPDPEIRTTMPPEQRGEFARLAARLEEVNNRAYWQLSLGQEWLIETEIRLRWLVSLKAAMEQTKRVRAAAVRCCHSCPTGPSWGTDATAEALPWTVGSGLSHLIWPREQDRWDERAPCFEEQPRALAEEIAANLAARWSETRAIEIVIAEVSRAEFGGEEIVHPKVTSAISELYAKIEDLRSNAPSPVSSVELPEPDAEAITAAGKALMAAQPQ